MARAKDNKKPLIIGGILVLVLLGILYFFSSNIFSLAAPPPSGAMLEGGDAINLGQVQYISSDPFYKEPVLPLLVYVTGSSSYQTGTTSSSLFATGAFSPSDIQSLAPNNAPILAQKFNLYEAADTSCLYTVIDPHITLYSYGLLECRAGCGINDCFDQQTLCNGKVSTPVGSIYYIDSAPIYDTQVNVSLILENGTIYSTNVSWNNPSSELSSAGRVKYLQSGQGQQGCPVPSTNTILFRPINTNQLIPKSNLDYNTWYNILQSGALSQQYGKLNNQLNVFLASNPVGSDKCKLVNTSAQQAIYKCRPDQPVSIPNLLITLKTSTIGIVIPSGIPKITNIQKSEIYAANLTQINVTVMNIADQTDSFDAKATAKIPITFTAFRQAIGSGQSAIIPVKIEGAGIIQNLNISVCSANSPGVCDSQLVKIQINPFCDKTKTAQQIFVVTDKGCQATCNNITTYDVNELTCQKFASLTDYIRPTITIGNTTELKHIEGNHCTGIGQWTTMDNYMDAVSAGILQPFYPTEKANFYWMPSPTCNYEPAYGYDSNGNELDASNPIIFDQSNTNIAANPSTLITLPSTCPSGTVLSGTTCVNTCTGSTTDHCEGNILSYGASCQSAGAIYTFQTTNCADLGLQCVDNTCKSIPTPTCPAINTLPCPTGQKVTSTTDSNGCVVPQCVLSPVITPVTNITPSIPTTPTEQTQPVTQDNTMWIVAGVVLVIALVGGAYLYLKSNKKRRR